MNTKPPSQELLWELSGRLSDIGLEKDALYDAELKALAYGRVLLVAVRTTEICKCCGKPVTHLRIGPHTKKTLDELFKR